MTIDMSLVARLLVVRCIATSSTILNDANVLQAREKYASTWQREDVHIDKHMSKLQIKFGKKPNIVYILADDVGWGELGWQGGGKHRGTPTPELDKMASEGMRFWSSYAEPSCTPSRVALLTGRHPVRTGLVDVLWPGENKGLSSEEVTIAEILSDAGYKTAMWGKWHLGDLPEHAPESQGFDYAYYGLWNGAPDNWPASSDMYEKMPNSNTALFYDFPGLQDYFESTGINLDHAGFIGRKDKGRTAINGTAGRLGPSRQEAFELESIEQIIKYVKDNARDKKPFFIYWATFAQQLQGSRNHHNDEHVDKVNAQASALAAHSAHVGKLLDTLNSEKIASNTLVLWISDNGPMYSFYPNSGYSWLRGGKGDVLEGGVRVPAMAWWPGVITPNQDPVDIIHITDLFTTAARLGRALDSVPGDRVTDGIDQMPLLLLGEGHGRRNAIFHYSGGSLAAVRHQDMKVHLKEGGHGGIPSMEIYNVKRDPGEKFNQLYQSLFAVTPIKNFIREHTLLASKYPHRVSSRAV